MDIAAIRPYLTELGFEPEVADIYFALYKHGPQTISELARSSGVERTHIYRLLDDITRSNLIEVEVQHKRNLYKAAPISNLQITIARKQQQLKGLQLELEALEKAMPQTSLSSPVTRVQFYHGSDGLNQMLWNQSKAKTDVAAILYENLQVHTKESFFERWIENRNTNRKRSFGIVSDDFVKSQKTWYQPEQKTTYLQNWYPRYVSPKLFPIKHSQIVYGNVVAYYNWKDGDIFGIEIYNREIADAQRHFFKLLWQQATPINELSDEIPSL